MGAYLLKLMIVLPIVCGLAWGSLMLWKRLQGGMPSLGQAQRAVRILDVTSMGASSKLVVVAFGGRQLLISATRGQIVLLAEAARDEDDA